MSKIILFDLDGTLTDSAEGITKSVQHALQSFGIQEPDLKKLECFVGPPLMEQFMKYAHMTQKQAEVAVSVYRERYSEIGIYENSVYNGIPELLASLKEEKKLLAVASSKPEYYVRKILKYFSLDQYFDEIVGANMDGSRTDKAEVVEEALSRLGASDIREEVLLVGDREYDVKGALKCGIQCIGAAYGYGSYEELSGAGAVYVAESVQDLRILSDRYRAKRREQLRTEGHMPDGKSTNARTEAEAFVDEDEAGKRDSDVKLSQRLQTAIPSPGAEKSPAQVHHGPLRKAWRVVYPLLTHYLAMVLVSAVGSMLLYTFYSQQNGGADINSLSDYISSMALPLTGIADALAIIPLYIFLRSDRKLRKSKMLGKAANNGKYAIRGIYLATIIFAITGSQWVNSLIDYSGLNDLFPSYSQLTETTFSNQNIWLMLFVLVIVAPISEELVFRGLICKRVQDYLGNGWAIFISALMFGIYHGNMVQFVYATILGLAFGMLMCRTNNLKVCCVAHMAANAWSCVSSSILNLLSSKNMMAYYGTLAIFLVMALLSFVSILAAKRKEIKMQN